MQRTDWAKWSAVAEIAGAVAIVVTLVYLAVQTQQNSRAILANSRNAIIASDLTLLSALIENPEMDMKLAAGDPLTRAEAEQMEAWLIALVRTREHQWFQFRDGLLDQQIWEAYLSAMTVTLSIRRARAWWDYVKVSYFDDEFVAAVDPIISATPVIADSEPVLHIIEGEAAAE